jgi:cation/acetate symporter
LIFSIGLILVGPAVNGPDALFPLENPGILSIPAGFLAAWAGTLLSRDRSSEVKFAELNVRSNTGLGAEKAMPH